MHRNTDFVRRNRLRLHAAALCLWLAALALKYQAGAETGTAAYLPLLTATAALAITLAAELLPNPPRQWLDARLKPRHARHELFPGLPLTPRQVREHAARGMPDYIIECPTGLIIFDKQGYIEGAN